MFSLFVMLGVFLAYSIGSIPTAVWYGKALHGVDVREHGSGNAGATNTFRVLGKKAGAIVMIGDSIKGWIATSLAYGLLHLDLIPVENLEFSQLLFGIVAVIGHIFPVWAGFRGGKGVATLLGMVFSIHIAGAFICLGVFIVVLTISKYVSLGSMLAALSFPIILMMPRFSPDQPIMIVFGFILFALVVITHQKNIIRLLNGVENKTIIRFRKENND